MIDLTLNNNEIIIAIAIILYVILISLASNKFHKWLNLIKKIQIRFKQKNIDEVVFKESIRLYENSIKRSKKVFYSLIFLTGALHLIICFNINSDPLSAIIPFIIFALVLLGVYWLKGSKVSSSIRNSSIGSEYRGL